MIGQDTLLRAVVANPSDEILPLVYADWLEESGDIRGEFLRIGFRLRLLPKDDDRCPLLQARLRELRSAIDPGWLATMGR